MNANPANNPRKNPRIPPMVLPGGPVVRRECPQRRLAWILPVIALLLLANLAGAQILINGGFESGLNNWTTNLASGGSAVFSSSSANKHAGGSALKVSVTSAGSASNAVQIISSTFAASATNTYVLRFWAWSSLPQASLGINLVGATPDRKTHV